MGTGPSNTTTNHTHVTQERIWPVVLNGPRSVRGPGVHKEIFRACMAFAAAHASSTNGTLEVQVEAGRKAAGKCVEGWWETIPEKDRKEIAKADDE